MPDTNQGSRKMNKWLYFGGGVLTGAVLTFLALFLIGTSSQESVQNDPGLTYFDQPGDVIESNSFKVFQSLSEGAALVSAENPKNTKYENIKYTGGLICLLVNNEGKFYYDDEIVKVPEGKVARQVGIYQYETKAEMGKTVPIVRIMDK